MTRVTAPSRLHFGLLSLPPADQSNARRFGGVGLMVDQPGIIVRVERAASWSASGPHAERAIAFAQRFLTASSIVIDGGFHIGVELAPAEHVGLGVGTQLGLAVARAIAVELQQFDCTEATIAESIGRGKRSAIGIHGFRQGGFIVDVGKTSDTKVSPIIPSPPFPNEWGVVLIIPREKGIWHGSREQAAFTAISSMGMPPEWTNRLAGLILLGMIPALMEERVESFGEAVYEYNRIAGEPFRSVQGDTYAVPATQSIIEMLRSWGIHGVGQSSWGPTVFGITPDADHNRWLVERLRNQLTATCWEIIGTSVSSGATITSSTIG